MTRLPFRSPFPPTGSLWPFRLPSWGKAYAERGGDAAADASWEAFRSALGRKGDSDRTEGSANPWRTPTGKALDRLARAGRLAWRVSAYVFAALVWAHVAFIAATSILVLCYRWIDPPATVLMFYRRFETGYRIVKPEPLDLPKLGKRRVDMLVRVEDRAFFGHPGFDLAAIKYAWKLNKKWGRPISGASTLSMQTARSLFLVPVKSYLRKYLEAIVTVELEVLLGKERILELYYYSAEWGRGIFGIQAASRNYYGVPVTRVSDERYARLISLLPSPLRFTPSTLFNHRTLAWRYDFLAERYLPQPAAEAQAQGGAASITEAPAAGAAPGEGAPTPASPPEAPAEGAGVKAAASNG